MRRNRPVLAWVIVGIALLFTLLPLAWLVSLSFSRQSDVAAGQLLPAAPNPENWAAALAGALPHGVANTLIVSFSGALIALLVGIPAAWAIVRSGTGGRALGATVLSPWLLPPIVAVLPLLLLLRQLQLNNTLAGLALVCGLANAPVAIWLLEGFVRRIPVELDEAAQLDGAGPVRVLLRIVLPLLAPGVVAVGVIVGLLCSQDLLFATFLTVSPDAQTAPVVLANLLGDKVQDFGKLAAASLVAAVPVFVIAVLLQRRLVAGLTSGALR
ncbi:carbohydrate ABC transporter permease [Microbacterium sp. SORGH_AS_0888]|uniref:carbohydrate ABC transporter permease n=1 Tax=Microbacterium sp. SORGH_AS_0888 TaxID=3041791 RepID=UPI00277F138D|nr:carbohydrate ABC transporter permease [Microbacterium sp. SORGH_AS_0888]MDQ1130898.1 multiple sugar transport system permease protein [Microbacterium sp. SORGH_AS_0888]